MESLHRLTGFTLLEVLIAVAITAMIGVGATQLLSNIIESRQAVDVRGEQLASLQRFDMIVSRDIEQYLHRSIRDEYGDSQPALQLNVHQYYFEFTRAGWRNSPQSERPRSELQRVAYQLENINSDACLIARERLERWGVQEFKGECLVRYFWPVLDRANNSQPVVQMLLEQVDRFEIEVLSGNTKKAGEGSQATAQPQNQRWHTTWPETNSMDAAGKKLLAVRWRFQLPSLGELERLWLIAAGDHHG